MPHLTRHIFICTNVRKPEDPKGCCSARGGDAVRDLFKQLVHERGLKRKVRANAAGCLDQCAHGAVVLIYPEQIWYGHVTPADVPEILERTVIEGKVIERLLLTDQPHLAGLPRA